MNRRPAFAEGNRRHRRFVGRHDITSATSRRSIFFLPTRLEFETQVHGIADHVVFDAIGHAPFAALDRGLLTLGCGRRSMRLIPPLDVTEREIVLGVELLLEAIEETESKADLPTDSTTVI
jgi:hypothetical protein